MTTLDFPVAPLIGDRFPTPSVAGMPQYIWDGEKWTTAANTITTAPPSTATPLEDNATPQIGVTTKYAREDHVHPSTALKYSAQTLSEAQKAQSRSNLYSAPFDALAYSGMQFNGSMEISQQNGSTPQTASGSWPCDGFIFYKTGSMVFGGASSQASPIAPGIQGVIYVTITTAQASLGASDFLVINHAIEGYRVARLAWGKPAAQPMTIAFWSMHNRTGLYTVNVSNGTRSYFATYTHAVSDVAQHNVITIPGDVAGTWKADNTTGLTIQFVIASGMVASAANTWLTETKQAAPGQVNGVASTSDVFRISGLIVLPGIEAPSAERSPLIMRPYDQELLTCQRYWESGVGLFTYRAGTGFQTGITSAYDTIPFLTRKRADPTMTFNAGWAYYNTADTQPAFTPTMSFVDTRCFGFMGSGFTNWKAWSRINNPIWYADARL